MISGAVRESAHPTMMANGCWSCAVSARRAATGLPVLTLLWANRLLPAFSRARASSGPTDGAVGSAAIAHPVRAIVTIKVRLQGCSFIIVRVREVRTSPWCVRTLKRIGSDNKHRVCVDPRHIVSLLHHRLDPASLVDFQQGEPIFGARRDHTVRFAYLKE